MGMFSKPSAPPPMDYAAAAQAQGASNKETALAEYQLNNANQVTPWGSTSLAQTDPNNPYGFTKTTTLDPQDQARLDQQRALQSSLLGLAPQAMNSAWNQLQQPLDTSKLPPMSYGVDAGGTRQLDLSGVSPLVSGQEQARQAQNAMFSQFYDRYAPAAQQAQNAMNARIANMGGVTTGTGGQRMMGGLLTSQGDQLRQGIYDAILKGNDVGAQQFGMGLQAHQQGVSDITGQTQFNNLANQQDVQNAFANANLANASRTQGLQEQSALRQMPLNELMAMLGGTQVNQPSFQPMQGTQIAPTPIFQGAQAQGQAAQNTYNQEMGSYNNMMSGLAGLGSAGIKYSDDRLKENVVRIGKTPGGHNLYEYDILGRHETGVMAQELLLTQPDAVVISKHGHLMVDYSKVE